MLAIVPFALILLGIALLPLLMPHAWERDSMKALFVALIAGPTAAYLLYTDGSLLLHAATEYASFIVLLGSLFIISGGVVIRGEPRFGNLGLLAFGAVLANLVGTTGASMLLIRPMLRANANRRYTQHIPIFFIFIVSNAGGLLTPLGDPPLFLGFLRGVPFTWTFTLLPAWLFVNGALLMAFAVFDRLKNPPEPAGAAKLSIDGPHHFIFLAGVIFAAAYLPFGAREAVMAIAAALSYAAAKKESHEANGFTFHPIVEVALLFVGIFVTIQPALAYLSEAAPSLGLTKPRDIYLLTGVLSSVLDNAPTYLAFFTVAQSIGEAGGPLVGTSGVPEPFLIAISLGAVLWGANTYIGNGPNFMVKAICDRSGFKTPSFFGYIAWSLAICGPLWLAVALIFT